MPRLPISPPSQDVYHVTNQRQSLQIQTPPRQEDFLRPVADPRNLLTNQYESQQISPYNQYGQQSQQNWVGHQSNQLLSQLPQYSGKSPILIEVKKIN